MTITTISSREFNQDTSRAKQAAKKGPVIITDRGRPAHVLITFEEYQRLTGQSYGSQTLGDLLGMPDAADVDFEPAPLKDPLSRPADFD